MSPLPIADFRPLASVCSISDLWQLAVGSKEFVEETKEELGALFESRKVEEKGGQYELHEHQAPYDHPEAMNTYQW